MAEEQTFKHIVRIANTDLDGNKPVYMAITKIRGVGRMYSNLVCHLAKIDRYSKVGTLSPEEVERITDVVFNPLKYNIPEWMMNRKKDIEDGLTKHLVSTDLDLAKENDIKLMKKIRSYRGIRHATGQPVRGQRTKSNFRRNKGHAIGVKKKKDAKAE